MKRNITPDQVQPFNPVYAEAEAPCGTRDGRVVCLHSFDGEVVGHFDTNAQYNVMERWSLDGTHSGDDRELDLVMHPCGMIDGLLYFYDTKIERRIPMTDLFEVVTVGDPAYKDGPCHADLIDANGIHWNGSLVYRKIDGNSKPVEECDHPMVRAIKAPSASEALDMIKEKVLEAIKEKMGEGDTSGMVALELPRELGELLEKMGVGLNIDLGSGSGIEAVLESIEKQKKNLH